MQMIHKIWDAITIGFMMLLVCFVVTPFPYYVSIAAIPLCLAIVFASPVLLIMSIVLLSISVIARTFFPEDDPKIQFQPPTPTVRTSPEAIAGVAQALAANVPFDKA